MTDSADFRFKQFSIRQDRCAMKVGTDGVLLGSWANEGEEIKTNGQDRILDIGTGTGLIALMMAQRFPEAHITAIDIDPDAASQAQENVDESPWKDRIEICNIALQDFYKAQEAKGDAEWRYDLIVSNPPYFPPHQVITADKGKVQNLHKHTDTLPIEDLIRCATKLLTEDGVMALILPPDTARLAERYAAIYGLFPKRQTSVSTTPSKPTKRILIEYSPRRPQEIKTEKQCISSAWYKDLTEPFYL